MLERQPIDDVVVTVCDRAHEELDPGPSWWHWSIPDPAETATEAAFDAVVAELDARIATLSTDAARYSPTNP
jgi:protein-tyrosine-phosphatase